MTSAWLPMTETVVNDMHSKRRVQRRWQTLLQVAVFQSRNMMRSRWLLAYAAFFLLVTEALLRFSGNGAGAILSLSNIVLFIVPLITLTVGTVYLYNAREFVELLLAQPINRQALFSGLYCGLAIPLALSVVVGMGLPFVLRGFASLHDVQLLSTLLVLGVALTFSFAGIALTVGLWCNDRLRGLSVVIALWLLAAVAYDGAVLGLISAFSDYPLERAILGLTVLNPIDLARVAMMLQLDVSALLGYTGAVFQQFLGSYAGSIVAFAAIALWIIVPFVLATRIFARKDF